MEGDDLVAKKVSLGAFIAKRRKYKDMTQEELAKRVGVSKSAIAKWETDGGIPDRDNLKRLSEVLNVSVDDLHKIINLETARDEDLKVNITPEVITILESYGYRVLRPGEDKED
ncbi:DNA-binding transcriptional regulator, XRE-family HTH domain [Lachnospiraceae bacterium XBB2008]|nr:DNA-binding transcriptional regulator, XRE-family HTH domain [Lachnospiraceae bacterium XBB2008]